MKTWKASNDPEYEAKKARVEHLYALSGGEVSPDGVAGHGEFGLDAVADV